MTVTSAATGDIPARTTWTLLLYLTSAVDGCIGGETVFYLNDRPLAKEGVAIAPETGMLLLHKHGNDCLLVSPSRVPCGNVRIHVSTNVTSRSAARRPRGHGRGEVGSTDGFMCGQVRREPKWTLSSSYLVPGNTTMTIARFNYWRCHYRPRCSRYPALRCSPCCEIVCIHFLSQLTASLA